MLDHVKQIEQVVLVSIIALLIIGSIVMVLPSMATKASEKRSSYDLTHLP